MNTLRFTIILILTQVYMNAEYQSPMEQPNVSYLHHNWDLIEANAIQNMDELHRLDWTSPHSVQVSVPSTVFGALVDAGKYPDPFFAQRLKEIDQKPFQSPWIYRTRFNLDHSLPNEYVELIFEGFNFSANVWLNGKQIAEANTFKGPFRVYNLDVSNVVTPQDNVLVVEIIRPAKDDLTIGWVDWNAYPPDDNIGLWRPVKIRQTGKISIDDVFVKTDLNLNSLDEADLSITGTLVNHTEQEQEGHLQFTLENRVLDFTFKLAPSETRELTFDPHDDKQLHIADPKIWWPHHLGEQPLYVLNVAVHHSGLISEQKQVRFGIREVSDYINEEGHRGWMVNGKKVLIRGGGWVDDLFLREDTRKIEAQVLYTKHMNLNTIRLEGFWGASQQLFDLCDEQGILMMIGWSCHWEWENYCNRPTDNYLLIKSAEDIEFHSQSFKEQVTWLRNHPSIITWVYGSDMIPRPELERALTERLDEVDTTRPRLVGCRQKSSDGELDFTSEMSGPVAVKMVGPYSYVTPNYWYVDKNYGGAYGFNTETGPGLQPTLFESMKKFTPEKDRWPLNDTWDFHSGRGEFATFKYWLKPFNARYGEADSAEDFCRRAQLSNYEAIRPMFESFSVNKPEATGVIQWMLNSALPNHLWQLFDYYLMPTGAFYGTRIACQPLNLAYNYADNSVYITNEYLEKMEGLVAEVKVLDAKANVIASFKESVSALPQSSSKWWTLPEKSNIESELYFLDLRIHDQKGAVVAQNFYWLSTKEDVQDFENSNWHITPNSSYADLSGINDLDPATVENTCVFSEQDGTITAEVTLENVSESIAFFLESKIAGRESGETILPVFWEDNYISLLPGEKRTLKATFSSLDLHGEEPVFSISGINVAPHLNAHQ